MKILHIGFGQPPQAMGCGPVVYVHTLALAQRAAGDTAVVLAASDQTAEGRPPYDPTVVAVDNIPYVLLRNRPVAEHDHWNPNREMSDPACRRAVVHVLRETQPDVVHIHNVVGLSFDVIEAAKDSGARIVMSLHNYFPLCSRDDLFFADAEHCPGPRYRSCSRCLGTMLGDAAYQARHQMAVDLINQCDVVLAVSTRVAEIYQQHGVQPDRLVVNRIGSHTAARLWDTFGHRRVIEAAAPSTPLRLTFFGSPIPRKGLSTLLQAVRHLRHPEQVEVHLLGNPPPAEVEHLAKGIRSFSPIHAQRFTFHGGFNQTMLDAFLARMDVAVLPPRWEDNGPQTVLESLGAGVPVIGTRMGGIIDMIQHEGNGLLVPEGDPVALAEAIDRLVEDPAFVTHLRSGIDPPLTIDRHRDALAAYYAPPMQARSAQPRIDSPDMVCDGYGACQPL